MQKKSKELSNISNCNKLILTGMLKRRKLAASSIAKACDYQLKIKVVK